MADVYRTLDVVLTEHELLSERETLSREHAALDGARERLAHADAERKADSKDVARRLWELQRSGLVTRVAKGLYRAVTP